CPFRSAIAGNFESGAIATLSVPGAHVDARTFAVCVRAVLRDRDKDDEAEDSLIVACLAEELLRIFPVLLCASEHGLEEWQVFENEAVSIVGEIAYHLL